MLACANPRATPAPTPVPPVVEAPPPPPPPALPPEEQRRELARRALELFDKKQWNDAVPALTEAASGYPEVAPFLRLRIAEAEGERGNTQQAVAILSEVVAIGDTSAATVARLRLPVLYAQLGDRASTEAAHRQAASIAIDELTEADFVSMATGLAKAGRTDLASATRMRLLTTYTQGRYTEQTFDFLKDALASLSAAEKSELAAKLARSDRYDQALTLLPPDAPEARATRLRALFNSRRYTELLAETDATLTDPALLLLRARAAWRVGQPAVFLEGLEQIEKKFPAGKEAVDAKVLRAKYYTTDEVDYARSIDNLSKAIDAGAAGNDGENVWNLGWTYTLWGKYDEALKVFERYINTYPDGDWKTNSLFWSAKIHEKLGQDAQRVARAGQIIAEYPFSYYAYRAKELWPDAAADAAAAPAAASPQLFPSVDLSSLNEPRLSTVRELQSIGLHRAAAREMKVVAAKYEDHPGVQFMLADVYVRGGEPFKANGVLQRRFRPFIRHGGTGIPQRFWEVLYPLAYWDTIRAEAERRGHDPYLIASIIRQESGFEPSTVSNAGAVGLMQIMPEEAARIATGGGLPEVTRADLFLPETNIAVGAAEFTQKLAAMDDNRTLAIAAYNAGETPVRDWMQRTPVEDIDRFIESIPYAETRLYVKTVTRNRNEYSRIYEGR
jgi:tetratricopeptide (TPR) repeat protein